MPLRRERFGDPTDHSCSHAPTPETESQLSPADPSCSHCTIWRRQGIAGSGLPRDDPEPSRGAQRRDRTPGVPAFSPAPTSEAKGSQRRPPAHLSPQTPELTAEGPCPTTADPLQSPLPAHFPTSGVLPASPLPLPNPVQV